MSAPIEDFLFEIKRYEAAVIEAVGAEVMGAVLCPEGSHGDFVNSEVVPGDLPCKSCGAAL